MEEIIKQLEARKTPNQRDDLDTLYNQTIDECIEILKSQKVIKAKALMKKGAGLYYVRNWAGWHTTKFPHQIMPEGGNTAKITLMTCGLKDAELITIEILIPE